MEFKGSWDTHLALMEFAYNNSYQASIEMAPFEALYGRKCRTPVCWDEVGERRLVGLELVQITSEKVKVVHDKLKIARDRQKSYQSLYSHLIASVCKTNQKNVLLCLRTNNSFFFFA